MNVTEETRRESYQEIQAEAPSRRMRIYRLLLDGGPMTAQEIMDKLGYTDPNRVRPRLTELQGCGLVRTVGKRPSRVTGKQTAVWEAVEEPLAAEGGTPNVSPAQRVAFGEEEQRSGMNIRRDADGMKRSLGQRKTAPGGNDTESGTADQTVNQIHPHYEGERGESQ